MGQVYVKRKLAYSQQENEWENLEGKMALAVKLEVFEGPLDLLLHLIDKNKIDIYDIPIVEITEQYLEYIKQLETEDMNVMSEFLLMASTLLDIKCRMLLPKEVNEDGEEQDPRDELVQKLLEYKMYKYMSFELKDREMDAGKNYYKEPTIPKEVAAYQLTLIVCLRMLILVNYMRFSRQP